MLGFPTYIQDPFFQKKDAFRTIQMYDPGEVNIHGQRSHQKLPQKAHTVYSKTNLKRNLKKQVFRDTGTTIAAPQSKSMPFD